MDVGEEQPAPEPGGHRRGGERRPGSALLGGLLVVTMLLGGVFLLAPGADRDDLRRLLGMEQDRLSAPLPVRSGSGTFKFLHTQRGSDEPVSYSPCRPVRYVVNPEGAPRDHLELVQGSVRRIEEATGLVFEYAGETTSRNFLARALDRSDPVLVGWATPEELPDLAGDVAGVAGSTMVSRGAGRREFVTGMVALDRDTFHELMGSPSGRAHAAAIMDHELGHLVGLDHVDDRGELMHPRGATQGRFGPGDLEGLARLGGVSC
ncbi:matrixin family metalloprotease [Nocardioides solisilvae]|uniref:matrixin family metalloprotease n=1 Tax=Nocardioides solisilvae TaxID=1542435 RepID=UPI000D74AB58|nr:matrixin family metalloprotease [Nocardioides solisilvae]